ncbi:TetR/AcrR family transcriptional regulator C-terminal domain-containing protein [Henriciella aquimarina]|uniref:TetR/AcrR family transcriptional regulator C-terminal domain-containing protein n=1 Tax=Henriciella aquimarina TaxID=545261 RepID=UPI000A02F6F6|nr:TetR/AcrR family transcriptional regulator C-terminal domain-containing protein [Henriciella aquimarina]
MADTSPPKRRRGRPPRISRKAIVDAVIKHGSDPTLAAISQQLGVTPQALYHHISSHSDLVELLLKEIVNAVGVPDPEGQTWHDYAIDLGLYMYKVYSAVPGLAEYALSTPWREPVIYQRQERLLEMAEADGFDPLKAFWASRAIADFVHGWVSREHRRQLGSSDADSDERDLYKKIPADSRKKLPLTEQGFHLESISEESRFEFTLRALITGLVETSKKQD